MSAPVIVYTNGPSGKCPVQAEGTINGREFYFRSRGEHWSLAVAGNSGDAMAVDAWTHREIYPGCVDEEPTELDGHKLKFGAGHAEPQECIAFIERTAKLWLAEQS